MFLILDVSSPNAASLGAAARMVFTRQGGSIGRRAGNDWVLADPHVSSRHARIRAMGGTFFLEDNESGNGVLVNGNRIHPGEPFPLKDGDVIFIDPFEITARISATPPGPVAAPVAAVPAFTPPAVPGGQTIATGQPAMGTGSDLSGIRWMVPPTGGLDDLLGTSAGGIPESNPLLDPAPVAPQRQIPTGIDLLGKSVLNDAMTIKPPPVPVQAPVVPKSPAGGGVIPTNWDLSDLGLDSSPPSAPIPAAPQPPVAPIVVPGFSQLSVPPPQEARPIPPAPAVPATPALPAAYAPPPPVAMPQVATPQLTAAPQAHAVAGSDLVQLLRGAGLDVDSIDPQVATQLGRVLRTVVEGLMEVLRARGEIKGEFRLQQTTFKPRENNPLKFSANVEDALHNLLVKRNAAYLDTPSAFEDAFADVRNHQVAMLAGMRAAFDYMLARFDPQTLATQFDAKSGRKLSIGLGAGSRHWESFGDFYKEMTRDPDDCFRRLFGDQFARAYEEQLQRLRAEGRRS